MASFVNEQKFVEDAFFKYEKKLKSPINRFLDKTPTYVKYFHINTDVTTTDAGFKDVASLLGSQSPIRYSAINNMPLYMDNPIQPQLSETDQGLDTSFEGEAVILPGEVKPLPDDLFMIPTLEQPCIFRVTEIGYDAVMSDGFYRINFKLDYIDPDQVKKLEKQISGKFEYIRKNIGTEEKCIIESEYVEELANIEKMYWEMADIYKTIFYNERYNCFLGEFGPNLRLYDPLMTQFINTHSLFNKKETYDSLILSDHYENDKYRRIKYEKSVYRFIERRDKDLANEFKYEKFFGRDLKESVFDRWYDNSVYIADIPANISDKADHIFSKEFVAAIKYNTVTESKHADLILRFVRREEIPLTTIPLDLNEELLTLNASLEVFFVVPLILYILKTIMNEFMETRSSRLETTKL